MFADNDVTMQWLPLSGKFVHKANGDKAKNAEGQMVVDFATRMEMDVVNTHFKKREEPRVTYKSGGRSMQVDYNIM